MWKICWSEIMQTNLQIELFKLQDLKYKEFHQKLMPTVNPDKVIGIRTPVLRKFAKGFGKRDEAKKFIKNLPHKYYEEDNLHAFLLEEIKDYEELIKELNIFLPFVDNWATCDMMRPKILKKHKTELLEDIKKWLSSNNTYTIRFAVNCLMNYYLEEDFKPEYLYWVKNIKSEEYYINMVRAWYFATALAKQYDEAVKILENKPLDKWTHNKTIQKAVESYRITDEQKIFLKSLKFK
ncbi:MAG: DNA alkylation repair protein [Clostridia bacterium]|nr:DNA alkylation repair protein [Clostridia bacterium]